MSDSFQLAHGGRTLPEGPLGQENRVRCLGLRRGRPVPDKCLPLTVTLSGIMECSTVGTLVLREAAPAPGLFAVSVRAGV